MVGIFFCLCFCLNSVQTVSPRAVCKYVNYVHLGCLEVTQRRITHKTAAAKADIDSNTKKEKDRFKGEMLERTRNLLEGIFLSGLKRIRD